MDLELIRLQRSAGTAAGDVLPIAAPEDYAECRRVMLAASKNYSFASRFFPPHKRKFVEALYALVRIGDDLVDVSHDGFASPLAAIEAWQRAYEAAFQSGGSDHPVLRAYLDTATRFEIPRQVMAPYFRAMKSDLYISRFATFADLLQYIEGSAAPVGQAMSYILEARKPFRVADCLPGADCLATAMQLSNFWRDVGEDWRLRRRIYIPQEDMARFGYTEDDLQAQRVDERLIALLEFQFRRTEAYYRRARQAVGLLASGRWAVMLGLEVYRAIIPAIRRSQYDVFTQRASVTPARRLGLVLKARLQTL